MDDESGYEVIEELDEELVQIEVPVPQIDDVHDTAPMAIPMRAGTFSEWPPEPPPPADSDLAAGSVTGVKPLPRTASIFAAVRRPTTSGDTDD